MEKNYKISIITVTKNSEKFLEECILSVQNQSYKNYEHLIIDGNSTDNTINVIKKHEQKLAYWISENDKGLYDAMNKGINKCSGDIIGILNSDDVYYDQTLKNSTTFNSVDKITCFLFNFFVSLEKFHDFFLSRRFPWSRGCISNPAFLIINRGPANSFFMSWLLKT